MNKPVKGEWYKSSRSNSGNQCVEVFHGDAVTRVRDTKEHGSGPVLEFPADSWTKFIDSRVWEI
ncbi:DUF397 domain-containing protein [Nocardia sp. 2]|uniref:DUF397 domain-containing protein n=1 Tax=Nocardia acididurans TaxID=2802282 RepID=A0ABS1MHP6_9NOCA|nr:DUF397 domain-containing protein [Nocardia acididurans]MBL1080191.1 DUF397 domain-containing protein [Nocardia acididurans]